MVSVATQLQMICGGEKNEPNWTDSSAKHTACFFSGSRFLLSEPTAGMNTILLDEV